MDDFGKRDESDENKNFLRYPCTKIHNKITSEIGTETEQLRFEMFQVHERESQGVTLESIILDILISCCYHEFIVRPAPIAALAVLAVIAI